MFMRTFAALRQCERTDGANGPPKPARARLTPTVTGTPCPPPSAQRRVPSESRGPPDREQDPGPVPDAPSVIDAKMPTAILRRSSKCQGVMINGCRMLAWPARWPGKPLWRRWQPRSGSPRGLPCWPNSWTGAASRPASSPGGPELRRPPPPVTSPGWWRRGSSGCICRVAIATTSLPPPSWLRRWRRYLSSHRCSRYARCDRGSPPRPCGRRDPATTISRVGSGWPYETGCWSPDAWWRSTNATTL